MMERPAASYLIFRIWFSPLQIGRRAVQVEISLMTHFLGSHSTLI